MYKNCIRWIVEGCQVGDTLKLFEGPQTTIITVTGIYGRCLLGKTENGCPKSVNYASLYSTESRVFAINPLTLTPVHVTPDHPAGHIRCRDKKTEKGLNPGGIQASGPSSGPRHKDSAALSA